MKSVLFLCLSLLPLATYAENENVSAYRNLKVDYSVYEKKVLQHDSEKILRSTPLSVARIYSEKALPDITSWKSLEDLQERFEDIRDERFLTTPARPDFPRRIAWLYPKDGCFARAALFNRTAFRKFIPIPQKVFAFGNLKVKTPFARSGVVGWWYHVAPIVEVGTTKYVLDPSIESTRPLKLKEWLERMGNPGAMKVAICDSGTYSPSDSCERKTDGIELRAEQVEKKYLSLEETELAKLGHESERSLGEEPPWLLK